MNKRLLAGMLGAAVGGLLCGGAWAQAASGAAAPAAAPTLEETVKDLQSRIAKLEKGGGSGAGLDVAWKDGLVFEGRNFKGKIGGRIHFDLFAAPQVDRELKEQYSGLGLSKSSFDSGVQLRRARIDVIGDILTDNFPTFYKFQVDFGGAGNSGKATTAIKDMYLGVRKLPVVGTVMVGHFNEPFSLEILTSDNDLEFMERSVASWTMAPERNLGLQLNNTLFEERMTWAVGAFRTTDDAAYNRGGNWAATGRVTGLPVYMDKGEKLVHVGGAYRYAVPDGKTLSYSAKVDNNMCPTLAKTGTLSGVDNVQLAGLEAAGVWGPFTAQGEYIASMVNRASSSNEDPTFDGWYVLGSWFITGETRPYDKANGIFKGIKPNSNFGSKEGHGWGAWELSARYQTIDLNKENIQGGQLNAWTFGLNWHLNKNFKVMADYSLADTDYPNNSGEQEARNVGVFGMRFQAAF